jgi:hypothetical protein
MNISAADGVPSSSDEIHQALFDRAINGQYYKVWGAPGEGPLPIYKQTLTSLLRGLLPFGKPFGFLRAARRTVSSRADLRWGVDHEILGAIYDRGNLTATTLTPSHAGNSGLRT